MCYVIEIVCLVNSLGKMLNTRVSVRTNVREILDKMVQNEMKKKCVEEKKN